MAVTRPDQPGPMRWGSITRAAVGLVAVALVVTVGYFATNQRDRVDQLEASEAKDSAAVDAAVEEAMAWTTVDYRDPDAYFDSIKAGASGDFLSELEETEKTLSDLLVDNETVQTANIPTDGAALVERSGDRATVLVTLDATVETKNEPESTLRQYRLRLTLERIDSRWLTTGLEFVG